MPCKFCVFGDHTSSSFAGFKTGYHFTDARNWVAIQRDGLVPYLTKNPSIRQEILAASGYSGPIEAVFVWYRKQTPMETLGSILFHTVGKFCTRVVELEVQYTARQLWLLPESRQMIALHHDQPPPSDPQAKLGLWHKGVPAVFTLQIPPKQIRLVATYDLHDLLRGQPTAPTGPPPSRLRRWFHARA
jgi:hypothetical protein